MSDSKAVALAVELEVASRFILSCPNGLHTDRCSYSQGRASPEYMQPSVFVVPAGLRLGKAISAACNSSSSPLLHIVGWSILRFQLPNLAILIHTRLLFDTTPHFGLLINHKRGAVDRETQLVD